MVNELVPRHISRRSLLAGSMAAIAGMTFPRIMHAQTPVASIPEKTLSGTVVTTTLGDPLSFNPNMQPDDYLYPIACNIFSTLFMLDDAYNVLPDLATGYEITGDGLSITVSLHPLATWHDGEPVTAADVKYTLEHIIASPETPASGPLDALDSVDVVDAHTAVLNLSRPSASMIGALAMGFVFILPAHIYAGTDWTTNPPNQAPVGSGPFIFQSYETGSAVELVGNPRYFADGPYLERLIFHILPDPATSLQALRTGDIDIASIPTAQAAGVETDDEIQVASQVFPSPLYVGFNTAVGPLDNADVRRAIGMAIDRDQIIATAFSGYGIPEDRYYPRVISWASNPEATAPTFDIAGANALLNDAGFPMDGDHRFTVQLVHFLEWPEAADAATVLKQQLGAIGVNVELVLLEFAAWQDRVLRGDFDFALLGGFQGPDPAHLAVRWGSDGALNYWRYRNPEFDDLLLMGDAAATQDERAPLYFAAQQVLAEDVPGIPLALQVAWFAFSTRLSGILPDSDDPDAPRNGTYRFTHIRVRDRTGTT